MPARPRYAIYARISKDATGESTAPARQERECRKLARERGYDVVAVYTDADLSAYRDVVRPHYEAMLAAMEAGELDGVLVWKLDRLMRRIVEFWRFWTVAQAKNVALVSKEEGWADTTTPIGLAILGFIFAMAEQESRNTSTRLKAKERELAEAGRHKAGGRRAYGMRPEWRELEPDEADVIREAAGRLLAGESVPSVVRDLNGRGIPSATGGQWSRRALVVLMRSARLFGWREHNGELVAAGDWPAILAEADGRRLRQLLDAGVGTAQTDGRRQWLLSGLLRCGKCGTPMKIGGTGPRQGRRYTCRPKTDGGCNGTVIDQAQADEAVTAMAMLRLEAPAVAAELRARAGRGRGEDTSALLAELAELEHRQAELADDWAAGELSRPAWKEAQRALEKRMDGLNDRLAAATRTAPALALVHAGAGVATAWEALPVERQRAVLTAVLDRIVVHGAGSEWYAARLREALEAEADEAEAAGNLELARRRRRQASARRGGGGTFRPERLEPVWRV